MGGALSGTGRDEPVEPPGVEHVEEVSLAERAGELAAAVRRGDPVPAGRLWGLPELDDGDVWVDIAGAATLAGVAERTITSWLSRHLPKANPFPPATRVLYRLYWPMSAITVWKAAQPGR